MLLVRHSDQRLCHELFLFQLNLQPMLTFKQRTSCMDGTVHKIISPFSTNPFSIFGFGTLLVIRLSSKIISYRLRPSRQPVIWHHVAGSVARQFSLWPPYVIGGHYIFALWFLSIVFFSSPNLSGHKLDLYHTSTYGVALVRIWNASLKCAARGSLQMQDPKKSPKIAIWAPSHNFVGLYLRN